LQVWDRFEELKAAVHDALLNTVLDPLIQAAKRHHALFHRPNVKWNEFVRTYIQDAMQEITQEEAGEVDRIFKSKRQKTRKLQKTKYNSKNVDSRMRAGLQSHTPTGPDTQAQDSYSSIVSHHAPHPLRNPMMQSPQGVWAGTQGDFGMNSTIQDASSPEISANELSEEDEHKSVRFAGPKPLPHQILPKYMQRATEREKVLVDMSGEGSWAKHEIQNREKKMRRDEMKVRRLEKQHEKGSRESVPFMTGQRQNRSQAVPTPGGIIRVKDKKAKQFQAPMAGLREAEQVIRVVEAAQQPEDGYTASDGAEGQGTNGEQGLGDTIPKPDAPPPTAAQTLGSIDSDPSAPQSLDSEALQTQPAADIDSAAATSGTALEAVEGAEGAASGGARAGARGSITESTGARGSITESTGVRGSITGSTAGAEAATVLPRIPTPQENQSKWTASQKRAGAVTDDWPFIEREIVVALPPLGQPPQSPFIF